jgi:hypothetical protein
MIHLSLKSVVQSIRSAGALRFEQTGFRMSPSRMPSTDHPLTICMDVIKAQLTAKRNVFPTKSDRHAGRGALAE